MSFEKPGQVPGFTFLPHAKVSTKHPSITLTVTAREQQFDFVENTYQAYNQDTPSYLHEVSVTPSSLAASTANRRQ